MPTPDDDIDVDTLILDADRPTGRRTWRQRALGGLTNAELARRRSQTGHVQLVIPIVGLRMYRAWCAEQHTTVTDHLRRLLLRDLADHGWQPSELAALEPRKQRMR